MEFKDIEFKKTKTYKVSRDMKMALLDWVVVSEWELPKIPATNSIKAEEILILWMTNLTKKDLEELSEEDYNKVLKEINKVQTVPTENSWEK